MEARILANGPVARSLLREDETHGLHVAKVLYDEFPDGRAIRQITKEYEITRKCDFPGVRRVLGRGKLNNHQAVYFEYVEGRTLKDFRAEDPPLREKLRVARDLLRVIHRLHGANVIHKDITPGNVLIRAADGEVVVIDFGLASRFSVRRQNLGNPKHLEGTLAYISPEQTGRMNRVIDRRTDIYSAGIVLYELLCGRTPFASDDAMSLVHAHLATPVPPLRAQAPELPEQLAAIVERMLIKDADRRYQSARGVAEDLDRCLRELEQGGKLGRFTPGEHDISPTFHLAQRLYGREEETAALLAAQAQVSQGNRGLVMVAGFSGTGKSALVSELHRPITEDRGFFVEGKFDQYQRAVPYFAISEAVRALVELLLTEDEARLDYFRQLIQEAVGTEGAVITELVPALELIIGSQPAVPEVGAADARNRFNYIFRRFVQALGQAEHPLTFFIDDLQWADSGSLELLEVLLTDPEQRYILCIGAYRDNEVGPAHPLHALLRSIEESGTPLLRIGIGNLREEDVNALVADSLLMDPATTRPLAELVMDKTGGNAYFVTQFLNSLYGEGLLGFDDTANRWTWDMDTIREQNLPDDIVELMAGKVRQMPEETQEILRLGACIGASFRLDDLSTIAHREVPEIERSLQPALIEGLVYRSEESIRFGHDRVQQAVYSLLPEDRRAELHHRIGRLLLERTSEEERHDRLFDIVNHLDLAAERIVDPQERSQLVELNLQAGIKAKESGAFAAAHDYVRQGIHLLGERHWEERHDLSLSLHTEAAETAFLSSEFGNMDGHVEQVLGHARNLTESLRAFEIRIQALKGQNRLPEALAAGLELMEKLGERFPKRPSMLLVVPDLIRTSWLLRGLSDEDIVNLPEITDPVKAAAIRVLANIAPSAYWSNPTIFPFLIFRMVQLSLRHGNSAVSAFAFATYGVIMVGALNQPKLAYRFGTLGLGILNKFRAKEWKTQVYTSVYGLINIWNEHVRNTLKPMRETYHIGLETGAIEFACVNANLYCINAYLIGLPLAELEAETSDFSRSFQSLNQNTSHTYNEIFRQGMLNFMGRAAGDPTVLTGEAMDEAEMLARCAETENRMATFQVYLNKMIVCNFFGDYATAWTYAERGRPLLDSVLAKLEVAYFHLHEALAALNAPDGSSGSRAARLRRARKNIRKLGGLARTAPANFLHKRELLLAEYLRIRGQPGKAGKYYELAMQHAGESDYLHEKALATELMARFQSEHNNRPSLFKFYLRRAVQLYAEWGAVAKVEQLSTRYPAIVTHGAGEARGTTAATSGTVSSETFSAGSLDLDTVLKASVSISGEIQLDRLLDRLLALLKENIGATRAVLLLREGERLVPRADSEAGAAAGGTTPVPDSVISFVERSRRELVLDDALSDRRFNQNDYILRQQPASIVAYPILNKGELAGVMYFENVLAKGAFTVERLELLRVLSGQIAISLENALLYESMERKVEERTARLAEEMEKSDQLLLNILPRQTAEELKTLGRAIPRRYDNVTVMFTDFVGFTRITEEMDPNEIVEEIDHYFGAFDEITTRHGLEKIKTIGDSYMCVGGLPEETAGHTPAVIRAAIEMRDFMWEDKLRRERANLPYFGIRIGINCGPVVAGVVGSKKFAYDIWGDTVNTASRMESNSESWMINVSGSVIGAVDGSFTFQHRGKIAAKNKGVIDMYFVEAPLPVVSAP